MIVMTMLVMTIMIVNPMKENPQWPEDYRSWTGTIEDLVREAGNVLRQISPEVEPPTLSGVRYYQSKRALGRGEKRGRTATFSFDDLATVVATKQMVKQQLPLALTRDMLSNAESGAFMKNAGLDNYCGYGSPAAAATMALTQSCQTNAAEQTVAKLLAASGLHATSPASNTMVRSTVSHVSKPSGITATAVAGPASPPLFATNLPPGGVLRYALDAGVQVEIPADIHDRTAQAKALRAFADQLDPPPTVTWSIK